MSIIKKLVVMAGLLASVGPLAGCSTMVGSHSPAYSTSTGELWYTKDTTFFIFYMGSTVYYCPKGGGVCYEAQITE